MIAFKKLFAEAQGGSTHTQAHTLNTHRTSCAYAAYAPNSSSTSIRDTQCIGVHRAHTWIMCTQFGWLSLYKRSIYTERTEFNARTLSLCCCCCPLSRSRTHIYKRIAHAHLRLTSALTCIACASTTNANDDDERVHVTICDRYQRRGLSIYTHTS